VKEMSLRRTVIIDENNICHSIPNSQIKLVSKKVKPSSESSNASGEKLKG